VGRAQQIINRNYSTSNGYKNEHSTANLKKLDEHRDASIKHNAYLSIRSEELKVPTTSGTLQANTARAHSLSPALLLLLLHQMIRGVCNVRHPNY